MSTSIAITLWCNGDNPQQPCDGRLDYFEQPTVVAARRHAKTIGWRSSGEEDYCPIHVGLLKPDFGPWLRRQTHREDAVGDLARDFVASPRSRAKTPQSVRADLDDHAAIEGAYDALDRAVAEWERRKPPPTRS